MIGVLPSTGGHELVGVTKGNQLLIWFGGVLKYQSVCEYSIKKRNEMAPCANKCVQTIRV